MNAEEFKFFSGYPSNIYQFALLIKEAGLCLTHPPKIILTGGEKLRVSQVKIIEEVCKCKVLDHYGFCEAAGNASRCEGGVYHEDFEFGLLEPYNIEQLSDGKISGEILTTSFSNIAIPLIRYQVGDVATWAKMDCKCGRYSTVISNIEGRIEDSVITPEGFRISRLDTIWEDTNHVIEAQIVQDKLNHVILRVVKDERFSKKDEMKILQNAEMCLTPKMVIDIEYIEAPQLEKTNAGKFKSVVSLLK